jgi:hypothetical protein
VGEVWIAQEDLLVIIIIIIIIIIDKKNGRIRRCVYHYI